MSLVGRAIKFGPAELTMVVNHQSCHARDASGQSLTEFALLLPLLLVVLFGALDLGRVFYAYVTVQNAAREGARYGISHPTEQANIDARTRREDQSLLSAIQAPIVECFRFADNSPVDCSMARNGDRIKVTVTLEFQLVSSSLFGLGAITISDSATMAITNGLPEGG